MPRVKVISLRRAAWRLLPTTITSALAAVARRPFAFLEPGKPRSGCGSSAGAFFPSYVFFLLAVFFSPNLGVRRPLPTALKTGDARMVREAPASSPIYCDCKLDVRHRFQPRTSERAEAFAPTTSTVYASADTSLPPQTRVRALERGTRFLFRFGLPTSSSRYRERADMFDPTNSFRARGGP